MATVYLAEDLEHHRTVAVKVQRPDLAATLELERFDPVPDLSPTQVAEGRGLLGVVAAKRGDCDEAMRWSDEVGRNDALYPRRKLWQARIAGARSGTSGPSVPPVVAAPTSPERYL